MRFLHTADLHLGRRLAQMPLEKDLDVVLDQLTELVQQKGADALVIAGDVFDSPNPSEASVRQWDAFLNRLADAGIAAFVVSGNHDSGARLGMGSTLIAHTGIVIAGELRGEVTHVRNGGVTFWLLPFVRPAEVRSWARGLGMDEDAVAAVNSYDAALRLVCDHIRSLDDFSEGPNVLVAHQFVTAGGSSPERSQSEQVSLGSLDNVDYRAFDGFSYVALGHVHRPQRIGRDSVRYAGSPLKLSASEIDYAKSYCLVDVSDDGDVTFELVPVKPLHDFRRQKGSVQELVARGQQEDVQRRQDYIQAVVTDDDAMDVVSRLRNVWPNLEEVVFDNALTRAAGADQVLSQEPAQKDLAQLFAEFFQQQAGRPLADDERALALDAFEKAQRGDQTDEEAKA